MADRRIEYYLRVLGVDASASPEALKRAHRDLAQVWHPDRFTTNPRLQKMAGQKLLEINQAYDFLRGRVSEPPLSATSAPPRPEPATARTEAPRAEPPAPAPVPPSRLGWPEWPSMAL